MMPGGPGRRVFIPALAAGLYAVTGFAAAEQNRLSAESAAESLAKTALAHPEWASKAVAALPAGWTLGRLYRIDEDAGKVLFAAFPFGADRPGTPGNAFDPGQTVEVTLSRRGDQLDVSGVSVYGRSPDDRIHSKNEDYHAKILDELYGQAEAEAGSGVTVCRLRGWALSESTSGTAVRAKPSDDAPIVGRLAPPYLSKSSEAALFDGWRTEFEITGYRDGWFRIRDAVPPGSPYGDAPPKGFPHTYSGAGWVRATEVSGAYSNTQMPVARLLQYPHVDAQDIPPAESVADNVGNLSGDGTLMRLHACSANWALTTSRDGQRGWWRGICSNQATNCS